MQVPWFGIICDRPGEPNPDLVRRCGCRGCGSQRLRKPIGWKFTSALRVIVRGVIARPCLALSHLSVGLCQTAGAPAVLVVSAAEPDQRGRLQRRRGGRRLFLRDIRGGLYRQHGGVVAPSLCAAATNIGTATTADAAASIWKIKRLVVLSYYTS